MKYLFWNTGKNKVNRYIELLINKYEIDIFALAEYNDNKDELLKKLSAHYHIPKIGCQRIDIFTSCKPNQIIHLSEGSHYTIKRVPHDKLGLINIVFVHFASQLYKNVDDDLLLESIKLKNEIEMLENKIGNDKTIVVGDLNMNPFDKGMISAAGLHSVPSRKIASKNTRKINSEEYKMFYNPMWNFFGDNIQPEGTYFYNASSRSVNYFWNIFDQVIIRPSLINSFKSSKMKIIDNVGEYNLLNRHGKPNKDISDHLPIIFEIN